MDEGARKGAEMAGEAWLMEGVRESLEMVTFGAKELTEKIEGMKMERWNGIDVEEWGEWKEEESKWAGICDEFEGMVEAVGTRYEALDESKVRYEDVIDGLVLDSDTMMNEGKAIKDAFRKVNDHLFDRCQEAMEGFIPSEVER